MGIAELSLLRLRTILLPATLPQRVLPTGGKQGAEAQLLSRFQISPLLMHDPIGHADGPFRIRAIREAQPEIRFNEPFLEDSKIPPRESGLFNLHGQILDLPAPG